MTAGTAVVGGRAGRDGPPRRDRQGRLALVAPIVVGVVIADAYGTVVNDRACVAAIDSLREQRAAGTTRPRAECAGDRRRAVLQRGGTSAKGG